MIRREFGNIGDQDGGARPSGKRVPSVSSIMNFKAAHALERDDDVRARLAQLDLTNRAACAVEFAAN